MWVWAQYLFCAAVILFAGSRLSRYGDIIAEKTGMGGTWVGLILMASITSLPELVTGISSVAVFDLPDIAAGDIFGSCMFNILILSFMDIGVAAPPLSSRAHQGHVLSAGFGILLIGLSAMVLFAGSKIPAAGWIGSQSIILLIVYAVAMKSIFVYERRRLTEFVKELAEERYQDITKGRAYFLYGVHAAFVVAAAVYLPHLGEQLAEITGLGQTFVGSIFIAFSTSLPEIVVTAAALRLGAIDMGVANLFGSNLFDIAILAIDDIFYTKGPLLAHVSEIHLVSAVAAMAMTAMAIIGLTYRAGKKALFLSWDSLGIILIYLFTMILLYVSR